MGGQGEVTPRPGKAGVDPPFLAGEFHCPGRQMRVYRAGGGVRCAAGPADLFASGFPARMGRLSVVFRLGRAGPDPRGRSPGSARKRRGKGQGGGQPQRASPGSRTPPAGTRVGSRRRVEEYRLHPPGRRFFVVSGSKAVPPPRSHQPPRGGKKGGLSGRISRMGRLTRGTGWNSITEGPSLVLPRGRLEGP